MPDRPCGAAAPFAGRPGPARHRLARLRRDCDAYVDTTLRELEESLGGALQMVSRSRASLWRAGPGRPANGAAAPQGRSGTGMDLID